MQIDPKEKMQKIQMPSQRVEKKEKEAVGSSQGREVAKIQGGKQVEPKAVHETSKPSEEPHSEGATKGQRINLRI